METERSTLEEVPIMEDGHDFFKVSRTRGFVDKSLLIETAFKHGSRVLITAPSKYGKSTNLHMMKCFLSDRSDRAKCEVFKTLDIYKRSKKFYKQHVHKYKVVFLDLTSGKSTSYSDALDAYRWAIHNTFLEHDYLLKTSVLKTSEEKIFSSWCDMNRGYKTKQKEDIVNDLSMLVEVLARQSGSKVIVLVDEYDSLINKAIYEEHIESNFYDIGNLTAKVLHTLLKDNIKVKLAMVCGISCVTPTFICESENLLLFDFPIDEEFRRFYGFWEDELNTIVKRIAYNESFINVKSLTTWYGRYFTVDLPIVFNMFSVLKFLKNKKLGSYWLIQHQAEMFVKLSTLPVVSRLIHQLLTMKSIILTYDGIQNFKLADFRYTYIYTNNIVNITMLARYLHEIGFINLTKFNPDSSHERYAKLIIHLPNREIYYILSHYFQSYIIQTCNLPAHYYIPHSYYKFVERCQKSRVADLSVIFNSYI